MKGQTEIFIDNLVGAPDNIKLAPDGSFWIALVQVSYNPPQLNVKLIKGECLKKMHLLSGTGNSSTAKFHTQIESFKTFVGNFPQIDEVGDGSIRQSNGSECCS